MSPAGETFASLGNHLSNPENIGVAVFDIGSTVLGAGALRRGCFVAGTAIAVADGSTAIEDIEVGDRVLTPDSYTTALDTGTERKTSYLDS